MVKSTAERVASRTVNFGSDVIGLNSVKKAAYRISDSAAVDICINDGEIICELTFEPALEESDADGVVAQFRKEVLDQDLRASISEETAAIRNAILAYAFSKTGLQGE